MATLNFNAAEVEPSKVFDAIPAGKYQVIINESEMRTAKTGTGQYLWFEFEVISGDYKGRKLWTRLNLENQHPDAVRMARADLSAICRAVNVLNPNDSIELHNLPLTVTVRCRKNQDNELVNEIKGFEPRESAVVQPPAGAPAATATATKTAPPWARGK